MIESLSPDSILYPHKRLFDTPTAPAAPAPSATRNVVVQAPPQQTPSEMKAQVANMIDELAQRGFDFRYNSLSVLTDSPGWTFVEQLKTMPAVDWSSLQARWKLPEVDACEELFSHSELFNLGERAYQSKANKWRDLRRDFLHHSDTTPHFSHKINGSTFANSGKVDFVSSIGPLFLEVKQEKANPSPISSRSYRVNSDVYNGVVQVAERVDVLSRMYAFLRVAFFFVLTGRGTFLLEFKRSSPEDWRVSRQTGTLNWFYLGRNDSLVNKVWHGLVERCRNPNFFVSSDGDVLSAAIAMLGVDPALCATKIIGHSCNSVYACSLTRSNRRLGFQGDICLKVVSSADDDGDNPNPEVEFSWRVGQESAKRGRACCYLAVITGWDEVPSVKWCSEEAAAHVAAITKNAPRLEKTYTNEDETSLAWWMCPTQSTTWTDKAVIIMTAGIYDHVITPDLWFNVVQVKVQEDLRFYRDIGILHRDVRRPNIVMFRADNGIERYELIDLSMAVVPGAVTVVYREHYRNCGQRVRAAALACGRENEAVVLDTYVWEKHDDDDMLWVLTKRFSENI